MVVGIGVGEFIIASDASPIAEHTKDVIYIKDNQVVKLESSGTYEVVNIEGVVETPYIEHIAFEVEKLEKGGYDHYKQKEIFEQSTTIHDALRGHILSDKSIHLRGVEELEEKFKNARRLIIVGCGTSWIAGLVGEYLIELLARIPVEVEYASEFRYRDPILGSDDVVIAISQSGETADTLAVLALAKERGATTYGIVNVVGSSIARITDAGSYIHVGPEIGVASTKAFTGVVAILSLLALLLAKNYETIDEEKYITLVSSLENIGEKIQHILNKESEIIEIAEKIMDKDNALFLGRGALFPIALEGALKLKEISYIHAEGYPSAEMKHGPIALVEKGFPVIVVASNDAMIDKVISNVEGVKARGALTIGIVRSGAEGVKNVFDYTIEIPNVEDELIPILSVVQLQLLAYHTAILRGADVDKPRNLAKSVTVE